jgi:hypothetical protein
MQQPTIIAPGCYAATSETHGTRYFPSTTLACLWLIDPESPLFGPPVVSPANDLDELLPGQMRHFFQLPV